MAKKLSEKDYCAASEFLGCSVASIKAVARVESGGRGGFDSRGRLLLRFEGHKFRGYTSKRFDRTYPHLSYPYARRKGKPHGYTGFNEAFKLDSTAALLSTSYGMFQPMGFNHADLGYETVNEMVDALKTGEGEQLLAFCRLIKKWGLDDELKRARLKDFTTFARAYNGKDYKSNNYHRKMYDNYKKFKAQKIDCSKYKEEKSKVSAESLEDEKLISPKEDASSSQNSHIPISDSADVSDLDQKFDSKISDLKDTALQTVEEEIETRTGELTTKLEELPGDLPEVPGSEKFKFEDLKPLAWNWFLKGWKGFKRVNIFNGTLFGGSIPTAFLTGNYRIIAIAAAVSILIFIFSTVFLFGVGVGALIIWYKNRSENKDYFKHWVETKHDPKMKNYQLEAKRVETLEDWKL